VHQSLQRSGYDYRNGVHGGASTPECCSEMVQPAMTLSRKETSTADRDGCSIGKDVLNLNERVGIRIALFVCIGK